MLSSAIYIYTVWSQFNNKMTDAISALAYSLCMNFTLIVTA